MEENRNSGFILILFAFSISVFFSATPPQRKYWIKFTDKIGTPYSVSTPSAFLTQRSIQRRLNQNISINTSDLPVTPAYISQLNTIPHLNVLYASKWLNGAVAAIDSGYFSQALSSVKSFSFVSDTIRVKKFRLDYNRDVAMSGLKSSQDNSVTSSCVYNYGGSLNQIRQLNIDCMHQSGYRGQGMVITVLDVGFDGVDSNPVFDSLRNENRILGVRDFVNGLTGSYAGGLHGCYVLSLMAGNYPGIAIGGAPKASYWLLKTEDGPSETISEEYNWIRGAEFADSVGADILTTSLGYTTFDLSFQDHSYSTLNGRTAPMSIVATMAARKGMFVLNAAGNEGGGDWKYIGVPADADSICTVGAVDTLGKIGIFSSYGPTSDGRIKPDLSACGVSSWVCPKTPACFPGNGTSFATPMLAGAVACFWQAHPGYKCKQVLDTLKKYASNFSHPDNRVGWGIPFLPCERKCNPQTSFIYSIENDGVVKFLSLNKCNASEYSYTWNYGDGKTGSANSNTHVYSVNGEYTTSLVISSSLTPGCDFNSGTQTIKINLDFDFNAYYDKNNLNLKIDFNKLSFSFISIDVSDMHGKVLYHENEDPTKNSFNISNIQIPTSVYIVKVRTSRGTKIKKFLKL